jgi:putative PIN family toxin of toxin-antitoxin system
MNTLEKVVFDNFTLINMVLRPSSDSNLALAYMALKRFDLCTCEASNEELRRILTSDKLDPYIRKETRLYLVSFVRHYSTQVDLTGEDLRTISPSCKDRRDNLFLALARKAGAGIIISGDEHLLAMNPWNGIRIMTATQFVKETPRTRTKAANPLRIGWLLAHGLPLVLIGLALILFLLVVGSWVPHP